MQTFATRNEALEWIECQEGFSPEPMNTYTRAEYYRCGTSIYVIRVNRKCCQVKKKVLIKDDCIMMCLKKGTHTCRKMYKDKHLVKSVSCKWLDVYESYFDAIVKTLVLYSISVEDAKDLAQEAFIRISGIEADSKKHFYNLWLKECFWIRWRLFRKGRQSISNDELNLYYHQKSFEVPMCSILGNDRQKKVISLTQYGYSVNDISEFLRESPASIYSVLRQAKTTLKRMLI